MSNAPKVGLLAVGLKGLIAAQAAQRHARLEVIATYPPLGTDEPGPEAFRDAFPDTEILVGRSVDFAALDRLLDLVFIAGWQFLVDSPTPTTVVLHDSLLPDLRGFAPTVTALILGRSQLGVSALLPAADADTGDLLAQHAVEVTHPLRIADAISLLSPAYEMCIRDVLRLAREGPLAGTPQNESEATYSIWRDEEDYWLDFRLPADRVLRTIFALDKPYRGACALVGEQRVTIHDAEVEMDINFAVRQPGKIWKVDASGPLVVCGAGMIRLKDIRHGDGSPYSNVKLRTRFSAPM